LVNIKDIEWFQTLSSPSKLKLIKLLLNMLNNERLTDPKKWNDIGMILYNCQLLDEEKEIDYIKLWENWSKKVKSYPDGFCKKHWEYFVELPLDGMNINCLLYYAREDN